MKAQTKQQLDYNHTLLNSLKVKDKVWVKNQRRLDEKVGNFSNKWLGPHAVEKKSKKGLYTLRNQSGAKLSKTHLFPFSSRTLIL